MKVLDLFAGVAGFSIGLSRAGMTTVAFAERDLFCQSILKKHYPGVKIYEDVKDVTKRRLTADGIGGVDVITAGFPCQPYSRANWKRKGREDSRDCTEATIRVVDDFKPTVFIGENTEGFIDIGMEAFVDDLEDIGYFTESLSIPACAFGLPTLERHIWIISTPSRERSQRHVEKTIQNIDSLQEQFQGSDTRILERWSTPESRVLRVGEGIPRGLDRSRVKAMGNAVDPTGPQLIGRAIMESECTQQSGTQSQPTSRNGETGSVTPRLL